MTRLGLWCCDSLLSVVLLKDKETLASFLEKKEAEKSKKSDGGAGGKGDNSWDEDGVAEAVV